MFKSKAIGLLAENGAADSMEVLLPYMERTIKPAEDNGRIRYEVVDNEGNPRIRSDGKNMEIADLIPELKTKMPHLFTAKVKGGGGSQSSAPSRQTVDVDSLDRFELARLGLEQRMGKK
jgi:hypothetical protein